MIGEKRCSSHYAPGLVKSNKTIKTCSGKGRKRKAKHQVLKNSKDLRAIAITDVGTVRMNNEDQVRFVRPSDIEQRKTKGFLALVADGMGGHASGEHASNLAVNIISRAYFDNPAPPLQALSAAMTKANHAIFTTAQKEKSMAGMGTTCTVAAIIGKHIYLAHIGDSRAYLISSDQIYQLTEDHTYVQDLLNKGKIEPPEAINHPQKHVLSKALGTSSVNRFDIFLSKIEFLSGNKILLCTDGFYEYFTNEEIKSTLQEYNLHKTGNILLEQARSRGGHDNISFLLIEEVVDDIKSEFPTQFLNK